MPANLDGGAVAARPAAPPAQTRMAVLPLNPPNSDALRASAWGPGYTCNPPASKLERDPKWPRPLDSLARTRSHGFQRAERLPHHPAASFGEWKQALPQMRQVLFDREASYGAAVELRPIL